MNETASTASDWAAAHRAKLDQVATTHAARVVPLAERTGLDVETAGMIVLSLAVELTDGDDQLAAITRAVVRAVDDGRRAATTAAIVGPEPCAYPRNPEHDHLICQDGDEWQAWDARRTERRKAADR